MERRPQSPTPTGASLPVFAAAMLLLVHLPYAAAFAPPSARPSAQCRPLLGGAGAVDRRSAVLRRMFEFPHPDHSRHDEDPNGASRGSGYGEPGRRWRVPASAVEELGRVGDGDGASDLLPFRFDMESVEAKKPKSSYYFPGLAKEAEKAMVAELSSGDATEVEGSLSAAVLTEKGKEATDDRPQPSIVVRHLEETDLPTVVRMCVDEFGSYSPPENDPFRRQRLGDDDALPGYVVVSNGDTDLTLGKLLQPLWARYENWVFSWVVRIGLYMRIQRSTEGFRGEADDDHNVVCLVETMAAAEGGEEEGEVVGIAELSLQPPDPVRNAPPYVLPLSIKSAISRQRGVDAPGAYVSNVLVRPDRRGRGYGRALMAACEGLARSWGCSEVSLHVDADLTSGRAAQVMYRSIGYEGVVDRRGADGGGKLGSMGPEMAQRGLYVVDGVPLLYLRKKLEDR